MLPEQNIAFVHISPEDANMFHIYQTMLHGENETYYQNAKESEALGTAKVKEFILNILKSSHSGLFVLKDMNTKEIYAHIVLQNGQTSRNSHKSEIYLGVLKQFQRVGVGKKLLEIADFWAQKNGIEKLQLSVFANNYNAIEFYHKCGYIEEGRLKNAVKFGENNYTDEIFMAKFFKAVDSADEKKESA